MAILNPLQLVVDSVQNLWFWTYGLVVGWGLTVTLIIIALGIMLIRQINLQRRIDRLENRLIAAERDYNITLSKYHK
jgi:hypothetical protein